MIKIKLKKKILCDKNEDCLKKINELIYKTFI